MRVRRRRRRRIPVWRLQLVVFVVEGTAVAFHLSACRRAAAGFGAVRCSSACGGGMGLPAFAHEEEEESAGDEGDEDEDTNYDAGDGAAGEAFVAMGDGGGRGCRGGEEDGRCWGGLGGCLHG